VQGRESPSVKDRLPGHIARSPIGGCYTDYKPETAQTVVFEAV